MADPGMNEGVAPEDRELRALLGDAHTIAVVGLSSKPDRPSFGVAAYLQEHGYRIVPVNPNETQVLGEPAYPALGDIRQASRGCGRRVPSPRKRLTSHGTPSRSAPRVLWLQAGCVSDGRTGSRPTRASRSS
jgi:predicted CoA-binding protein